MSIFAKLFGSSKKEETLTPQQSLQHLQEKEEIYHKKQEFLEEKIKAELAVAKANGTSNKRVALMALRKKKKLELELEHLEGVLSTISKQRSALENAAMNMDVLNTLSGAAKSLKKAHNQLDPDKVHDLMDEISEQQETANEIAKAISDARDTEDDEELLKELEEMQQADLEEKLLDVGGIPIDNITKDLPEAPKKELPPPEKTSAAKKKEEDKDLAELEAWTAS